MADFLIITANPGLYSNQRLLESAQKMGLSLKVHHPKQEKPKTLPKGALLRLGLENLKEGLNLAKALEKEGCSVLNMSRATDVAKNKWSSYQVLQKNQLPVVTSKLIQPGDESQEAPFAYPFILKTLYGSKGVGLHCVSSPNDLKKLLTFYHHKNFSVIVQPYIKPVQDLRIFVIGGKVVAAVDRQLAPGEFRANWHRGAKLKKIKPSEEMISLATRATEVLGLEICGLDLIFDGQQFLILEANDSPGLEGIEKVCQKDLATLILRRLQIGSPGPEAVPSPN